TALSTRASASAMRAAAYVESAPAGTPIAASSGARSCGATSSKPAGRVPHEQRRGAIATRAEPSPRGLLHSGERRKWTSPQARQRKRARVDHSSAQKDSRSTPRSFASGRPFASRMRPRGASTSRADARDSRASRRQRSPPTTWSVAARTQTAPSPTVTITRRIANLRRSVTRPPDERVEHARPLEEREEGPREETGPERDGDPAHERGQAEPLRRDRD